VLPLCKAARKVCVSCSGITALRHKKVIFAAASATRFLFSILLCPECVYPPFYITHTLKMHLSLDVKDGISRRARERRNCNLESSNKEGRVGVWGQLGTVTQSESTRYLACQSASISRAQKKAANKNGSFVRRETMVSDQKQLSRLFLLLQVPRVRVKTHTLLG
jgi:hypothetical protein